MSRHLEHDEQAALFQWAALQENVYPELALMFAVPNGGHRHKAVAAKMKAEGQRAGVPDIFLPVSRYPYFGLFIEMKVGRNKTTPKQDWWLEQLEKQGYYTTVCYGWEAAKELIVSYLTGSLSGNPIENT